MAEPVSVEHLTVQEKLLLSQAVYKVGAVNWDVISKLLVEHPCIVGRPTEYFSPEACEQAYVALMTSIEINVPAPDAAKPQAKVHLQLARNFYFARMQELQTQITTYEHRFIELMSEVNSIKSGEMDSKIHAEIRAALAKKYGKKMVDTWAPLPEEVQEVIAAGPESAKTPAPAAEDQQPKDEVVEEPAVAATDAAAETPASTKNAKAEAETTDETEASVEPVAEATAESAEQREESAEPVTPIEEVEESPEEAAAEEANTEEATESPEEPTVAEDAEAEPETEAATDADGDVDMATEDEPAEEEAEPVAEDAEDEEEKEEVEEQDRESPIEKEEEALIAEEDKEAAEAMMKEQDEDEAAEERMEEEVAAGMPPEIEDGSNASSPVEDQAEVEPAEAEPVTEVEAEVLAHAEDVDEEEEKKEEANEDAEDREEAGTREETESAAASPKAPATPASSHGSALSPASELSPLPGDDASQKEAPSSPTPASRRGRKRKAGANPRGGPPSKRGGRRAASPVPSDHASEHEDEDEVKEEEEEETGRGRRSTRRGRKAGTPAKDASPTPKRGTSASSAASGTPTAPEGRRRGRPRVMRDDVVSKSVRGASEATSVKEEEKEDEDMDEDHEDHEDEKPATRTSGRRKAAAAESTPVQRGKRSGRTPRAGTRESVGVDEDGDESPASAPASAPVSAGPASTARGNKSAQKLILSLLDTIHQHKNASVFAAPVKKTEAPNYTEVIKRPMDLKTIRARIKDGSISTIDEFERDLRLMFANAIVYNARGSQVYQMARDMQAESEKHIAHYKSMQHHLSR